MSPRRTVPHLQARCARTGRQLSIPADRVKAVEPTRARTDVVMRDGDERIPLADDPADVTRQWHRLVPNEADRG